MTTKTIPTETPNPPRWVNTPASNKAWRENLAWRAKAATSKNKLYRDVLKSAAEWLYGTGR